MGLGFNSLSIPQSMLISLQEFGHEVFFCREHMNTSGLVLYQREEGVDKEKNTQ